MGLSRRADSQYLLDTVRFGAHSLPYSEAQQGCGRGSADSAEALTNEGATQGFNLLGESDDLTCV